MKKQSEAETCQCTSAAPPQHCGVMTEKIKGGKTEGLRDIRSASWALCCRASLTEIKAGCL